MRFMDRKEDVLDLQLTPWGEHLLSLGKFKPVYYSFHDNNILYDSRRAGERPKSEDATATKDIQKRIQDDTPQPRTQTVFKSSQFYETDYRLAVDLDPTALEGVKAKEEFAPGPMGAHDASVERTTGVETVVRYSNLSTTTQKVPYYSMSDTLGKTENLNRNNASWKIYYLNGELTGSSATTTTQAEPVTMIPQLSSSVEYTISLIDDPKFKSDFELAVQFPDGKTLDIRPDYLLLSIEEDGSKYVNDKFEIEVFEVEDISIGDYVSYNVGDTSGVVNSRAEERLRRIYFTKKIDVVENNLLLEDTEIKALIRQAAGQYPSDLLANTYFDVLVDNEIEESILLKSVDVMESKGFYVDTGVLKRETADIALVDIYETESAYEACPELDDDCDEEGE